MHSAPELVRERQRRTLTVPPFPLLEAVMPERYDEPAKEICNALLDHAVRQDGRLRQSGDADLIDDKTVFIVKRS
jgi:hypothetical protein